jgi:hypothetical protein
MVAKAGRQAQALELIAVPIGVTASRLLRASSGILALKHALPARRRFGLYASRIFRFVLATFVAAVTAPAGAQQAEVYPSRSVRVIVNSPGGNPDILARLLAQRLTATLGQSFVVEDMQGAGGALAAKFVSSARGDGYVLYLGDSGTLAINPALNPRSPTIRCATSPRSPRWSTFRLSWWCIRVSPQTRCWSSSRWRRRSQGR